MLKIMFSPSTEDAADLQIYRLYRKDGVKLKPKQEAAGCACWTWRRSLWRHQCSQKLWKSKNGTIVFDILASPVKNIKKII